MAIVLVGVDLFARSARIQALLPTTFRRALLVNSCGESLAVVTPLRAGGEPIRFLGFLRSGVAGPIILAAFATETLVDAFVLLAGAAVFAVAFAFHERSWPSHLWSSVWPGHSIDAIGVIALVVLALFLLRLLRPDLAAIAGTFASVAWGSFRRQSLTTLITAAVLTVISLGARAAILAVFLISVPGLSIGTILLGASATLYAVLLSPTPSGIGVVEAGFFAGLHTRMASADLMSLMVTWRSYSLVLVATVGAILLLRQRLQPVALAPAADRSTEQL